MSWSAPIPNRVFASSVTPTASAEIIDPVTFPQELFDSLGDIYSTISDLKFKNYLNEYLAERDTPVDDLEEIIEISSDDDFPIDETVLERLEEAQSRGSFTDNFYQRTLDTGAGHDPADSHRADEGT